MIVTIPLPAGYAGTSAAFFAFLTGLFLAADSFTAALFVTAGAVFFTAFESLGLGFECSGVVFDGCLAFFAGRVFASLARVTAAYASRSSSRVWAQLAEDHSVLRW
jgi:hypothetical protein